MIQAAIITVGNELLSGFTIDTNAAYLGRQLWSLGIPLATAVTVPDEIDRIVQALERVSADADLVLITGGLGPTDDDLTRHALARFLGVELVLDEKQWDHIQAFFARRHYPMSERNRIQAEFPRGSRSIDNPHGTAPGILAQRAGKTWIAMPGVPSEMKPMFETAVVPLAETLAPAQSVVVKRLRCFGVGESTLAERLGDRMSRDRNPLVNCTVDHGLLTLHIVAQAAAADEAQALARGEADALRRELGDLVYGEDRQTLAGVIGARLTAQGKTLATAESCTGGLIAKMLTDEPGASAFFSQGWVTYSNQAKIDRLGVSARDLDQYGAVSEPVARAMVMGACRRAGTDYGIAVTGVAGPGGGTTEKPVGLVYVATATPQDCQVEHYQFSRDRHFVRFRTAQTALNDFRRRLVF
jgi:nicotinamide-nucleotide amidase